MINLRNILVRMGLKSRTEIELMPSFIEEPISDFVAAVANLVAISNEGIQPGMTEHEAYLVRKSVSGMVDTFQYRYSRAIVEAEDRVLSTEKMISGINFREDLDV